VSKPQNPPTALINKNHHKIETRTKNPNLKKLNNTTVMSIDEETVNTRGRSVRGDGKGVSAVLKDKGRFNAGSNYFSLFFGVESSRIRT